LPIPDAPDDLVELLLLRRERPLRYSQWDVRGGSVKRVGEAISESAAVVTLIHQHLAIGA
jgi:hypothetical protein